MRLNPGESNARQRKRYKGEWRYIQKTERDREERKEKNSRISIREFHRIECLEFQTIEGLNKSASQ